MPSSRRVELSLRARQDVSEILQYTLTEWGERQRDAYGAALSAAFARLAAMPDIGTPDEHLPDGRRLRCREHVIYYQPRGNVVFVVRVLHHKMSAAERLMVE